MASETLEPGSSPQIKISDLLNFTSAIFVAIAGSFLYLSGWVYLATWYRFFGLDATQLEIPFQVVLLHGLPSTLILTICLLTTTALFTYYATIQQDEGLSLKNIPLIILFASVLSFSIFNILFTLGPVKEPTIETSLSYASLLFMGILLVAFRQLNWISTETSARLRFSLSALTNFDLKRVRDLLARKESVASEIKEEARQIESVRETRAAAFRSFFLKSWKSWIGLAMIVYLLPSISFSAVIGRWDAVRGRRLLIGNWGIPEVIVYSDKTIVGLPNNPYRKINVEGGYAYMWLGLLANTREAYYFIDLKYVAPFYIPPYLYVVPKSSDVHISLVLQPNNIDAPSEGLEDPVAITETPMPSLMPTVTPTRALIPTSQPAETLTNSPTP